jgi:hypothetical protein
VQLFNPEPESGNTPAPQTFNPVTN